MCNKMGHRSCSEHTVSWGTGTELSLVWPSACALEVHPMPSAASTTAMCLKLKPGPLLRCPSPAEFKRLGNALPHPALSKCPKQNTRLTPCLANRRVSNKVACGNIMTPGYSRLESLTART